MLIDNILKQRVKWQLATDVYCKTKNELKISAIILVMF